MQKKNVMQVIPKKFLKYISKSEKFENVKI